MRIKRHLGEKFWRNGHEIASSDEQSVTIRFGMDNGANAYCATRACPILYDDRLTKMFAHSRTEKARYKIANAAGRERHNDLDKLIGIGICGRTDADKCARSYRKR